jgi:hypothetical protein
MKISLLLTCIVAEQMLSLTEVRKTASEAYKLMYTIPMSDRYKPYYWRVNTLYAFMSGYDVNSKWANST